MAARYRSALEYSFMLHLACTSVAIKRRHSNIYLFMEETPIHLHSNDSGLAEIIFCPEDSITHGHKLSR